MNYPNTNGQATKASTLRFCLLLSLLWCGVSTAWAQTTAFTYQGRLTDAGNPANGNYDLQFKLFDALAGGAQQGATLVRTPVAASAGSFTVTLDFGANVFSGPDRFLEIGVRPAGSANAYTVLAPRQQLTSSPYAIQTLNAQQLGGLPASGFVQNSAAPQAGANFNIGGNGTANAFSLSGGAPPAVAPAGQGRLYFDTATSKVKVSENGAAFVNLVGASGVSGSGTVNTIPLWSAGTTLGNSLISQSATTVNLPAFVSLALTPQGNGIGFGTPNTETGITINGVSGRADLRYDGTLKLVNGPGGIPSPLNGIAITTAGNVGIGIAAPTTKLYVLSNTVGTSAIFAEADQARGVWGKSNSSRGVYGESATNVGVWGFSSTSTGVFGDSAGVNGVGGFFQNSGGGIALKVQGTGSVGVLQITGGLDLAEHFEVAAGAKPGLLVAIDPRQPGKLAVARGAYNRKVAGVISGANKLAAGMVLTNPAGTKDSLPIALSGRVWVYCDARKISISPGDLLTTSHLPGHAMKAANAARAQGAIIGKAMTGLKSGRGLVLVLVTLQ
ncbi:MAG: hypothetical protein HYR56_09760 [Acidobacteria bacterium]|nr:hypothetical protein [Acidobacteriota bacterium]MBI3425650.1 hypothetical protein [Acidobacteriota bacterium]